MSWHQLIDAGLGRGAIGHRARIGWLHRLYRGVYAVGYLPLTREGWWMAAVLACGENAALSHPSAAALWDVRPSSSGKIDVTVATRNGRAARDRIRLHRSGSLSGEEVTTHRGIPVTTVARTLLDLAPMVSPAGLARAVERAEILELFDLAAIERTLERHPTHPGAARLSAAIDLYRGDEPTRSKLERMFLALCDAHGLPRPLVNHVVEGDEVDFLWPEQRLIVETDGRATHLTHAAFERDRARDARYVVLGYRVLRFTYRQVRDDAPTVAGTLRPLLANRPATAQERSMSSIR